MSIMAEEFLILPLRQGYSFLCSSSNKHLFVHMPLEDSKGQMTQIGMIEHVDSGKWKKWEMPADNLILKCQRKQH